MFLDIHELVTYLGIWSNDPYTTSRDILLSGFAHKTSPNVRVLTKDPLTLV